MSPRVSMHEVELSAHGPWKVTEFTLEMIYICKLDSCELNTNTVFKPWPITLRVS